MSDQIVKELQEKLAGKEWLHDVVGRGSQIYIYAKSEPYGLGRLLERPHNYIGQSTYQGMPVRVIIYTPDPKPAPGEIVLPNQTSC